MSETYGNTSTHNDDDARDLGTVGTSPTSGTGALGTDPPSATSGGASGGTSGGTSGAGGAIGGGSTGTLSSSDTKDVAKEEARATGEQAKEGARHVAEVGKDEAKNVAHETTQQAKELWQQTRTQLLDQSAQQQTRVAEGLRSLSQELSGMARGSDQQGMASDLAQQASQRMGDVAGWLDQRDPGSLVSEVKQFARQRPGAFLAAAAVIGLVGGRLSRGLVADHQDQSDTVAPTSTGTRTASPVDHSTAGYSAYGSAPGTTSPGGEYPVTDSLSEAGGVHRGTGPVSGAGPVSGTEPVGGVGSEGGEFPR